MQISDSLLALVLHFSDSGLYNSRNLYIGELNCCLVDESGILANQLVDNPILYCCMKLLWTDEISSPKIITT
jgi:hypothetical protein